MDALRVVTAAVPGVGVEPRAGLRCPMTQVRLLPMAAALLLAGCGPGLEFNVNQMTPDQMAERATHIFVGLIEKHEFEWWPFFRIPGDDSGHWRVLRRRVRVDAVLRGREPRPIVDIYEIFWTGGAMGDWNFTDVNERYLFLVRLENRRYHVVGDWWRSIYEVNSGQHRRLPLDESRPLWERVALMMWWAQPSRSRRFGGLRHTDPGHALGAWRTVKLLRGLLRHPEHDVRLAACESLLHWSIAQDECWDSFSAEEQKLLNRFHNVIPPEEAWKSNRRFEEGASRRWVQSFTNAGRSRVEMDYLRLFTTMNSQPRRAEYCRLFQQAFPSDKDHGCPSDRARPATIVTQDGDVPLVGPWRSYQ